MNKRAIAYITLVCIIISLFIVIWSAWNLMWSQYDQDYYVVIFTYIGFCAYLLSIFRFTDKNIYLTNMTYMFFGMAMGAVIGWPPASIVTYPVGFTILFFIIAFIYETSIYILRIKEPIVHPDEEEYLANSIN